MKKRRLLLLLFCLLGAGCNTPGQAQEVDILDSGGPLSREQAAYDVTFYDLEVAVQPARQTIQGLLTMHAAIVQPVSRLVLDLDTVFTINSVELLPENGATTALPFENHNGKLRCSLPLTKQPGDRVALRIRYEGAPRVADRPPWGGGFTWAHTENGDPWVATSVQGEGADLWWPCKDHPSDEPDSMSIRLTVPEPLVAASNGRLRQVTKNADGTRTYHWFVSTPVNNYGVALNVAPYEVLEDTFRSVSGDEFPVVFYVLPESLEKGRRLLPQIKRHLAFYEKYLGPYPFRADKYGVAQTPFLGMEHQTIIAYGSDFTDNEFGFDWLHHHELGHEWWGNMVTAPDWRDFWIHEGLCTYMQALYAEELHGREAYLAELKGYRRALRNSKPLAPRQPRSSDEMYFVNGSRLISDNDIYYKGAWVLHSLRYLIGDRAFFTALRRMAYPEPEMEAMTDGRQCRFAGTQDFQRIAEEASGMKLGWFFEAYFRHAELPRLEQEHTAQGLRLRWKTALPVFPMPVEVRIGDRTTRIEMPGGEALVSAPDSSEPVVDPDHLVLKASEPGEL